MAFQDRTLTCRDCSATFVFTVGEQEFYAQKGFQHEPTRCISCRQTRKRDRGGKPADAGARNDQGTRARHGSGIQAEAGSTTAHSGGWEAPGFSEAS